MSQLVDNQITISENSTKVILTLLVPIMIEMILISLTGYVDMAMIGYLGADALAGLEISNSLIYTITVLATAFSIGGTVQVTRYVATNEYKKLKCSIGQMINITLVLSTFVFGVAYLFQYEMLNIMGARDVVFNVATDYLSVLVFSLPFAIFTAMANGMIRGSGNMKLPLYSTIAANGLNILLNFFFIFPTREVTMLGANYWVLGLNLGVKGAALATLISKVVPIVILLVYYFIVKKLKFDVSVLTYHHEETKRILKIGLPSCLESIVLRAGMMVYLSIVTTLGTVAIAAHSVANAAESISYQPGFSFHLVTITVIGQLYGAKMFTKIKKTLNILLKYCVIVMTFFGCLFVFVPQFFICLFTSDQNVVELASTVLRIQGIAQFFFALYMVYSGYLKAMGKTQTLFIVSIVSIWGVRIPLSLLLIGLFDMGLVGAWIPMMLDYVVKATIAFIMYKKVMKKSAEQELIEEMSVHQMKKAMA